MPEIPVKKHWVVAAFMPSEEIGEVGEIGTVDATLYTSLAAANERARQLAAENPGAYYVSYEAGFYGHTDEPAVHVAKVVTV
jgi:hypothetical protein